MNASCGALRIPNSCAPLLERTDHSAPSVFRPENMLRKARRQKGLSSGDVPPVCMLDPDGDIVDHVRQHYGLPWRWKLPHSTRSPGARARPVICLALVSNQLGCIEGDFEKGERNGACESIDLVMALASAWSCAAPLLAEPASAAVI